MEFALTSNIFGNVFPVPRERNGVPPATNLLYEMLPERYGGGLLAATC
jgi:hypothetical protein